MLVQVGVDHRAAPLAWRERVAVDSLAAGRLAARLVRGTAAREALVLSTCSRVAVYAVGPVAGHLERELLEGFARRARCPLEELAGVVDVRHGAGAARHLLRTAAGLESPVLGEHEILGQVRRAQESATAVGAMGPVLERLAVHAVRAGRRVRAETGLAAGAASLTTTVVAMARRRVGDPAGRRALVIGRTRTAGDAAERLLGDGWSVTTSPDTAELAPMLTAFDVVVSCSGGEVTIGPETLRDASRGRAGPPLLVVDLSVPRDIDPAVRGLVGVVVHDVDDLAIAAGQTVAERERHVTAAEAIVEDELRRFHEWRATRAVVPTLKALRDHHRRAVAEVLGELPDAIVERLVTRLLHAPTARLRAAAAAGTGERWAGTARELYGLPEDPTRSEPA